MEHLESRGGDPVFILRPKDITFLKGEGRFTRIFFTSSDSVEVIGEPIKVMDFLFPPFETSDDPQDAPNEVLVKSEEEEFELEQARQIYELKFGIPLRRDEDLPKEWLELIKENRALPRG